MPTYDYSCEHCKGTFTQYLGVDSRSVPLDVPCPSCGTVGSVRRAIGNSGGFRLGTRGKVSWSKGGYSTLLGDVWKSERS